MRSSCPACRRCLPSPPRNLYPWLEPTLLLKLLGDAGAQLEEIMLLNGRFVLKAELGAAALQILISSRRVSAPVFAGREGNKELLWS